MVKNPWELFKHHINYLYTLVENTLITNKSNIKDKNNWEVSIVRKPFYEGFYYINLKGLTENQETRELFMVTFVSSDYFPQLKINLENLVKRRMIKKFKILADYEKFQWRFSYN